jgi:hypothetical protein
MLARLRVDDLCVHMLLLLSSFGHHSRRGHSLSNLIVRNGGGDVLEISPRIISYLWNGDSLRTAWAHSAEYFSKLWAELPEGSRPHLLLHGSPESVRSDRFSPLVDVVRRTLPGVEIAAGIAGDARLAAWRAGEIEAAPVVDRLVGAAIAIERKLPGAIATWDFEQGWKDRDGDKRSREEHEALARDVVTKAAKAAPSLVYGLTSYDHVGHHTRLPWRGFLVGTPVKLFLDQRYTDVGDPSQGRIPARERSADASQLKAERLGILPADVTPDTPDDLDRVHLYQLHGQHQGDLITAFVEHEHAAGWCAPVMPHGRSDESGLSAMRAALKIRSLVGAGPGAVRRFQSLHGLVADGIVGPKTMAALGLAS